jgi:methionyl-tRNA formyltransferase
MTLSCARPRAFSLDPTGVTDVDGRSGVPPVRTVFLGSGSFGVPTLRALVEHPDIDLVAVVTSPERPAGRGGRPAATPIHEEATAVGLSPILTPDRLRAAEATRQVLELDPGLLVLADYGQIVPATMLDLRHGALNLHPSLLPRHRGATPVASTILAGDRESGVTLIRMDDGLDTGPIVAQDRRPLAGTERTPDLEQSLAADAADLLARSMGPWIKGRLPADPQPDDGATMTRRLRRADGRIDPTRPGVELERQIRAFQPWPGSFIDTNVGRVVVWVAAVDPGAGPVIGRFDAVGLGVGAGDRLRLIEVQPAGGRRMSWDAFRRGRPAIVDSHIVNPES